MNGTKRCTKCKEEKRFVDFAVCNTSSTGLLARCRKCINAANRERYHRDPENARALQRIKARRLYRQNPRKAIETARRSYAKHAEKRREHARQQHRANRERALTRMSLYSQTHRAERNEYARKRRKRMSDEQRKKETEAKNEWRRRNRTKARASLKLSKLKRKGAPVGDSLAVRKYYEHVAATPRLRCYYCGRVTRKTDRHVDHVIPLSRGGHHCVSNLCCACATCNLRKSKKTDEEFTGQLRLIK